MNEKFLRRVKRNDRIARWVITLGGVAIIFSVIFILLLIASVALPLFQEPKAEVYAKFPMEQDGNNGDALGLGVDDYLETGFIIDSEGSFLFFETRDGDITDRVPISPPGEDSQARPVRCEDRGRQRFGMLWSDGSLSLDEVVFKPFFDPEQDNKRTILHEVRRLGAFPPQSEEPPLRSLGRISDEGRRTRVDLVAEGSLRVSQKLVSENFLGEVSEEDFAERLEVPVEAGRMTSLALSGDGLALYAGTRSGWLLRWSLQEPGKALLLDSAQAFPDGRTITALGLVYGEVSLAVGDDRGLVTTWFPVRTEDGDNRKKLHRIHDLSRHESPVVEIQPSLREKSVLSRGADGHLHLDHMTSERHLLEMAGHEPVLRYAFSQRSDSVIGLTAEGQGIVWKLHNPHPEVSWKTLFGKVWYEGYDHPEMAWQSSSASDDFEAKFSLTPLIFGTLKGTFYAMLFALPLALFGAIYTSQFCRPRLREIIKPAVEVMAAIPTVIIGFLAALWLAPLIEASLGALFLSLIFIPAGLMIAIISWQGMRKLEPLKRVERGFEFLAIGPVLVLAVASAAVLGPLAENLLFNGDLKLWLYQEWGTRYDPRNCIIIAFGMGFAVIPIIFTIAEDSLSNVPPSLKAASLACGASRWQTVWRVILPSASPGIFAGTMIGFGRAVGETMIVLMATGNTAIMDWSIFNGMRPLSANIAVEIPEAPHGGTLYRILFLSAVILFLMTFVVNTVAELVRQRLRKKYGRF